MNTGPPKLNLDHIFRSTSRIHQDVEWYSEVGAAFNHSDNCPAVAGKRDCRVTITRVKDAEKNTRSISAAEFNWYRNTAHFPVAQNLSNRRGENSVRSRLGEVRYKLMLGGTHK